MSAPGPSSLAQSIARHRTAGCNASDSPFLNRTKCSGMICTFQSAWHVPEGVLFQDRRCNHNHEGAPEMICTFQNVPHVRKWSLLATMIYNVLDIPEWSASSWISCAFLDHVTWSLDRSTLSRTGNTTCSRMICAFQSAPRDPEWSTNPPVQYVISHITLQVQEPSACPLDLEVLEVSTWNVVDRMY